MKNRFGLMAGMLMASLITIASFLTITTTTTMAQGSISLRPFIVEAPGGVIPGSVRTNIDRWLYGNSAMPVEVTPIPIGGTLDLQNMGNLEGQMFAVGFRVNGPLFSLSEIMVNQTGPFGNMSGTLGSMGLNYGSVYGFGVGDKGTQYWSGNAQTPVVQAVGIYPVSPLSSLRIGGVENVRYTLGNVSSSASFTVAVPEPSTWALGCLGGLGFWIMFFRKKRLFR